MDDILFELILFTASILLGIAVPLLPRKQQRWLVGILALVLLVISLVWLGYGLLSQEKYQETEPTQSPASTPGNAPTQTIPPPIIRDFQTCPQPCDGSNQQKTFPSKVEQIYLKWSYENFTPNAHYVLRWSLEGREWLRTDCAWDGPLSNLDLLEKIEEPRGLPSGTWEITILVDEQVLLQEQVFVEGKWSYWDPPGVYHSCFAR